ncbi:MAG TPA: carbohydrate ABC transporter permease [Devosia sp.]|nr:carbohydrate ABC transporter permease [Devosia sp.]
MSKLLLKILSFAAIAMIFVWSLVPVLFIVINSFRFPRDILIYPPPINTNFSFDNYFDLVKNYPTFFGYMGNSAIIAISATVIGVIVSACAGYVYSRFPGRFTSISGFYLIAVRLLPGLVISIPLFPLVGYLGLMDTHAILILLYVTFWVSVNTFVMKAFIDQIPKELDEAALIDGASSLQVLFKIILPLSAQGMVAAAVFVFVASWNDYVSALIFTTQMAKTTPPVLGEIMDSVVGTNFGVLFAGATAQLLPVLIVVIVLQRWIVAGLTAGSVKG